MGCSYACYSDTPASLFRLLPTGIDCSWSPSGLVAARSCFWWISGVSVSHGVDTGGSRLRPAALGLCLWLIALEHPLLRIYFLTDSSKQERRQYRELSWQLGSGAVLATRNGAELATEK